MLSRKNIADWKLVWGFINRCPLAVFSRKAIFFRRSEFLVVSYLPLSLIWLLGWGVLSGLEKLGDWGYNRSVQKTFCFPGAEVMSRPCPFLKGSGKQDIWKIKKWK